ncbi:MAG TPA: fumarylacetoacetate hydrolase family protein [Steroidobacteraceae bacterium]|nr:fumarylacetoacetate hydrolase family protein [Steroidobacteraceae bacterium]
MKRARVAHAGAVHDAVAASPACGAAREADGTGGEHAQLADEGGGEHVRLADGAGGEHVQLADGRIVSEDAVVWLPPFEVGTVIALGLNYRDHARELQLDSQEEPLVFLKGPGSLLGHRGRTRRPADAAFMHYECELAVVIGRPARRVARERALEHVAGYCIANDYAVRDYLENWYRPNLRVKNRDGCTVLGPWLVDAADVPDPGALGLRTFVNGKLTQQGNTRDLIFGIPVLIEYLSSFMTLSPGDVILTGTPEGVGNVMPGDVVTCEIDGLGRQINSLAADAEFGRGKHEVPCESSI